MRHCSSVTLLHTPTCVAPSLSCARALQVEKEAEKEAKKSAVDEVLYCLCRKPYNPSRLYVCCDLCEEWFHAKCVGIGNKAIKAIEEFVCPACEATSGQRTTWKERRTPKQPKQPSAPTNTNTRASAGAGTSSDHTAMGGEACSTGSKKKSKRARNDDKHAYPIVKLRLCYPRVKLRLRLLPPVDDVVKSLVMTPPADLAAVKTLAETATVNDRVDDGGAAPQVGNAAPSRFRSGLRGTSPPNTSPPPSLPASPPGTPAFAGGTDSNPALPDAAAPSAVQPFALDSSCAPTNPSATASDDAALVTSNASPDDGGSTLAASAAAWLQAGSAVEVAIAVVGMQGSWYPASVMEAFDDDALISISGLRSASQPDAALQERYPVTQLRPAAPRSPAVFMEQLTQGSLVEFWYQQGWWHALVKERPALTNASLTTGGEWVLQSVQYGNCHRVSDPLLRPCWSWSYRTGGWATISELTLPALPPVRAPAAAAAPVPVKPVVKQAEATPAPAATALEPEPAPASTFAPAAAATSLAPALAKRPAKRKLNDVSVREREESQRREAKGLLLENFAVGKLVEVRGQEDGFFGSWYAARVLEVREARSAVKLRLCYLAFQEEDGSCCEDWIELQHVRPIPPDHEPGFIEGLKKGGPLEVNVEEGWWEVELCGAVGPDLFLVAAKRYQANAFVLALCTAARIPAALLLASHNHAHAHDTCDVIAARADRLLQLTDRRLARIFPFSAGRAQRAAFPTAACVEVGGAKAHLGGARAQRQS